LKDPDIILKEYDVSHRSGVSSYILIFGLFGVSSRCLIFRQSGASFSWPGRSPGIGSNPAPGSARADSQTVRRL
jgi:hypothetical protein